MKISSQAMLFAPFYNDLGNHEFKFFAGKYLPPFLEFFEEIPIQLKTCFDQDPVVH